MRDHEKTDDVADHFAYDARPDAALSFAVVVAAVVGIILVGVFVAVVAAVSDVWIARLKR